LSQSAVIQQVSNQQLDIQRLQTEISSGQRIATPSDDAPAALRAEVLQRLIELKTQAQTNLQATQSYLDASDAALANVSSLHTDVRSSAVAAASDTSTDATRQAAADEVNQALDQLLTVGNQNFRGRYLFAGSRS